MKMKKIASLLLTVVLLIMLVPVAMVNAATTNAPNRVINLVYDDSGSMIKVDDELVDTWCQAKYAMEVFAALLGENDTLNIYVMSNYSRPKLVLKGADGAASNVGKVHSMVTSAEGTPFDSVRKAYNDLAATKADEKWLVVLTDGEFQNVTNIDAYFAQKSQDIKVMFLGMGPYADGITSNEANNIYYKEAKTNSEILRQVTSISTQIFNSHRLEVNVSSKVFSFDVPMSELVVFAQGANVKINGIKNADGKSFASSKTPVVVKYSDKAATNYKDFIISKDLLGSVATFKDDFAAGQYTVDVSGAETIEIYYKPNVEIAAYLKDAEGNEVTDLTDLEAGEYTIGFGFVKGGTQKKVSQSKLLGDVAYEAKVTNNGKLHDRTYTSGDKIVLEEGTLSINAVARYLDYNTVSTQLDYTIFRNKKIAYEVLQSPQLEVEIKGFKEAKPIVVKATIDGKEFTQEQWKEMKVPEVTLAESQKFKLSDFKVEKTEEAGVFNIYPMFEDGKPSSGVYADCNLNISYKEKHGNETWTGKGELSLKMTDNRLWIYKYPWIIPLAIILFLVFGHMPGVKKRFSKNIKKYPIIQGYPKHPGINPQTCEGSFKIKICSIIMPYCPQVAELTFVPDSACGVSCMRLRATKRKGMVLQNIKDFRGRDDITISGELVAPDEKNRILSSGDTLEYISKEMRYVCQLDTDGTEEY